MDRAPARGGKGRPRRAGEHHGHPEPHLEGARVQRQRAPRSRRGSGQGPRPGDRGHEGGARRGAQGDRRGEDGDRKSTRLNSSHITISYAVFCLKKKKKKKTTRRNIKTKKKMIDININQITLNEHI